MVSRGLFGPTPHRPGGPPVWIGGSVVAARQRTGRLFDGWFPNAPSPADARINAYLERYCGMRPDAMRKRQMCLAGDATEAAAWRKSYADAGVVHMSLRLAGKPEPQMEAVAPTRVELGW